MAYSCNLQLNNAPDTYGFIYGTVEDRQGQVHQVNILPPQAAWNGQTRLEGHLPDATDWQIYLDGEVVAKVADQTQIENQLAAHL